MQVSLRSAYSSSLYCRFTFNNQIPISSTRKLTGVSSSEDSRLADQKDRQVAASLGFTDISFSLICCTNFGAIRFLYRMNLSWPLLIAVNNNIFLRLILVIVRKKREGLLILFIK